MNFPTNTIKRAFDLAERLPTIAQIRLALKQEGYPAVEEHLAGKGIRGQLNAVIARQH